MSSWPLNGKKGGNRKHSKIDTLPPEMKATVEEMIMDGSATYSDIVAYLEQQGYSLSVSSVCRYAQGYVENLQPSASMTAACSTPTALRGNTLTVYATPLMPVKPVL